MLKDKRGMTLIEVILSIVVVAFCVLPVCNGLLFGKKQVEISEERITALELAQGKLEETISYNFDDLNNVNQAIHFNDPYRDYSYTVNVTHDADYPGKMKIISITVYYMDNITQEINSVELTGARAQR